ncbi:MAG: cupin domain-containing protein [Thermomicrobiales bacterium]|nr:cupin domain-containing protein [Thermomicrobiales bacterium]
MSHGTDENRPDSAEDPGRHPGGFWVQPEEASASSRFAAFYYKVDELPKIQPAPGVEMSMMVGGEMMANWVRIEPNAGIPMHAHPHEQLGLVLEGEIEMTIDGDTRICRPGDAYTIPGEVPHSGMAGPEGCLVLDLFSPPREDYIAQVTQQG